MLSYEGLLALCLLFVFIEDIGRFQLQMSRILFVLLDKPRGGKPTPPAIENGLPAGCIWVDLKVVIYTIDALDGLWD